MRSLENAAIPERLRGVFTTRRYTNTRLPLPLPYLLSVYLMSVEQYSVTTDMGHGSAYRLLLPIPTVTI